MLGATARSLREGRDVSLPDPGHSAVGPLHRLQCRGHRDQLGGHPIIASNTRSSARKRPTSASRRTRGTKPGTPCTAHLASAETCIQCRKPTATCADAAGCSPGVSLPVDGNVRVDLHERRQRRQEGVVASTSTPVVCTPIESFMSARRCHRCCPVRHWMIGVGRGELPVRVPSHWYSGPSASFPAAATARANRLGRRSERCWPCSCRSEE
jgi:hypothetical protein